MKKTFIKLISFLLIILIVIIAPTCAFAQTSKESDAQLLQDGDFDIDYGTYSDNGILSLSSLEKTIYNGLLNVDESITISSLYGIKADDFVNIYSNVINDNPDLFYVSSTVYYSYNTVTGYVTKVTPYYVMTKDEIVDSKIIFNDGVNKALSKIDDTMTDEQKALTIHDYICDNAYYVENGEMSHSAYGFFKDGKIVCAGYSLAYSYLMNKIGVPCEYVSSNAMQHAWNTVCIDDCWYNVDCTWDDLEIYNDNEQNYGVFIHRCFLKSDTSLYGEMGFYHTDGKTYDECKNTNTKYDNYFWNSINSNIITKNNAYYYMYCNNNTRTATLAKRDKDNKQTIVNNNIQYSYANFTITNTGTDNNGNDYEIKYFDPLVRLIELDNRFYVSAKRNIYSIDQKGNSYDIIDLPTYPTGLSVNGKNIVYTYYNNAELFTLDKKQMFSNHISDTTNKKYNNYVDINNDGFVNAKDFIQIIK